jgi:hypothetical protein
LQVQNQVLAVQGRKLVREPSAALQRYRPEVTWTNLLADVAPHATGIVNEELIDDGLTLRLPNFKFRIVLQGDCHTFDGAGALALMTGNTKRLISLEVPEQ